MFEGRAWWVAAVAGSLLALTPTALADDNSESKLAKAAVTADEHKEKEHQGEHDSEDHAHAEHDHEENHDPTDEELAQERIAELKREVAELKAEYDLLSQIQRNELQKMELERNELAAKKALREAELEAKITKMSEEVTYLRAKLELRDTRERAELAEMRSEIERRELEMRMARVESEEAVHELSLELNEVKTMNALLSERVKNAGLEKQLATIEADAIIGELRSKEALRRTKDDVGSRVLDDLDYPKNPLRGDTLLISDRRIELNGPIYSGVSEYVTERIHYYNNLDEDAPIFIVIDRSPGGSVMEGYRILEAMKNSEAPVHVVVKQFAASMAALITTLADHSYAYPNAIILHHQMSYGSGGNMTQQAEQLESAQEWARRLMDPLAEKMGTTPERLVEMMYENASTGDWEEFADVAVDLKWVDHVISDIREESLREEPRASNQPFFFFFGAEEKVDSEGERYIQLPAPQPFDFYFIYDPFEYYRW